MLCLLKTCQVGKPILPSCLIDHGSFFWIPIFCTMVQFHARTLCKLHKWDLRDKVCWQRDIDQPEQQIQISPEIIEFPYKQTCWHFPTILRKTFPWKRFSVSIILAIHLTSWTMSRVDINIAVFPNGVVKCSTLTLVPAIPLSTKRCTVSFLKIITCCI